MRARQILKSAIAVIILIVLGILTGALLTKKPSKKIDDDATKAKEEKKNEIKNTPADALVSDADNADELRAEKHGIRDDFRERIRNRLRQELHRLGASGADTDCGAGS